MVEIAQNDEEAQIRYKTYKSLDPFPSIYPSLLNSADIRDYAGVTGMIYPYNDLNIKPATYGLKLLGTIIYWDDANVKQEIELKKDDKFILKSNSIAFVSTDSKLRMPDYIAARFNLKISHIYKGILLGTGPIIDPGFCGVLSLPLHNLTQNDYEFIGGETLIWIEFTKITENESWKKLSIDAVKRIGNYTPFESKGRENRTIKDYLMEANPHGTIQSSLPPLAKRTLEAIDKAEAAFKKTEKLSEKISERVETALSRYNIGLLFSFATIIGAIATIVSLFKADVREMKGDFKDFKKSQDTIQVLKQTINKTSNRVDLLERKLDSLKK